MHIEVGESGAEETSGSGERQECDSRQKVFSQCGLNTQERDVGVSNVFWDMGG